MKHILQSIEKEWNHHLFDYLILATAGIFFLLGINIFKGERLTEFIILSAFTCIYIIWGIYHHIIDDTLHLKTVVEYILIGFSLLFLAKIVIFP